MNPKHKFVEPTFVIDPARYHVTFFRAVRAELTKLLQLRSVWVTNLLFLLFYTLIIFAGGLAQKNFANTIGISPHTVFIDQVTGGITFGVIFATAIGAISVTSEYSSNTMRTTILAYPRRVRALLSKLTALALFQAVFYAVLTAVATCAYIIAIRGHFEWNSDNLRPLVMFWLMLTLTCMMAMGLGYLIRHTAGTIITMVAMLFLSMVVLLIRWDWVQETLSLYLPANVLSAATYSSMGQELLEDGNMLTWNQAGIAWVIYMLVFLALGLIRYVRSDA